MAITSQPLSPPMSSLVLRFGFSGVADQLIVQISNSKNLRWRLTAIFMYKMTVTSKPVCQLTRCLVLSREVVRPSVCLSVRPSVCNVAVS